MKTDIDTCLIEIVDWFIKNRKPMTSENIRPIFAKHCESEAEIKKVHNLLKSKVGERRFRALLRERIKK